MKHLQYFLEVADQKSFTKAARHLYVSQPTISKMVRNIEDEFGVTLLDRSGKEMTLTDAGETVYEQSRSIVASFEHLSDALASLTGPERGKLRLGLPPMVGGRFFSGMIRSFRIDYPGIELQIAEYGAKKAVELVDNGEVEVAITIGDYDSQKFEGFVFHDEPLSVVIPPNCPLSKKGSVSLVDLKNQSFILFPEEFSLRGMIIQSCEKAGFQPKIVMESSREDLIMELVSEKLGITLLPAGIVQGANLHESKVLRLDGQELTWKLSMVWRRNHYLSFAAKQWIDRARVCLCKSSVDRVID
ncbi:MAG: LysR family transcriptional regulator [Sporolactobacillus sp.]